MKKIGIIISIFIAIVIFCSCTKQITSYVPVGAPFPYPTAYNFSNVNDSIQKKVLLNIDSLIATVDQGNTSNVVDTGKLKGIFTNTSLGYSLGSLCTPVAQTDLLNYFDSVGVFSHSTVIGNNGVTGVVTSPSVGSYLQSDSGFAYSEIIRASIMEGLIAYQIETIHLGGDSINNSLLITIPILQRNWDAGFGYFDVPIDYPTNTAGANYWGATASALSAALGADTIIMDNFLIGRAAINNDHILTSGNVVNVTDYSAIADANNIIAAMDNLLAGAAIHALNQAKISDSLSDDVAARFYLSTSWGFIHSLNYNASPARQNVATQPILAAYGTNLYRFNFAYRNVDSLRTVIGNMYGFLNTNF
jgi:hypothetical protein